MLKSTLRCSRGRRSARSASAGLALMAAAMMATPSFAASTNYTWNDTTNPGTDANWSPAANWNPTSGPPGKVNTDTATFTGTPGTFATPNLDVNESIGEL